MEVFGLKRGIFIASCVLFLTGCVFDEKGDEGSSSASSNTNNSNSTSTQPTVINGHTLPPEPDPIVNDSTLLGIDVNGNGVRDDVERKIYLTFNKEVKRQYYMQEARLLQAMLGDPELIQNAHAWQKKNNYDIACGSYLYRKHKVILKLENIQFVEEAVLTTKDRLRKYLKYDRELSGGVYSVPNEIRVESSCDFNVTEALK